MERILLMGESIQIYICCGMFGQRPSMRQHSEGREAATNIYIDR